MNLNDPELKDFLHQLLLPSTFCERIADKSESVKTIYSLLDDGSHKKRKFLLGLLFSFITLAEELTQQAKSETIIHVFKKYPPLTETSKGKANSLSLGSPVLSLRNHYNEVEKVIRHYLQRVSYPNCAPHATQAREQYKQQFEEICSMSGGERLALGQILWDRILKIPYLKAEDGSKREVRPFEFAIQNFQNSRNEPPGAVLQGFVYAYYRADSPSVTFRPYKVGAGSSRVGAAGDIDGWVGTILALSVEVKDLPITEENLNEFDQFQLQLSRWPNCTAIVVAQSFTEQAEKYLNDHQILCMTRTTMVKNVSYWDVPKQKLAIRELNYYFGVIQGHPKLIDRFKRFCEDNGISLKV